MAPDDYVAGAIPILSSRIWIYDRFCHAPTDACRLLQCVAATHRFPLVNISFHVQMQVILIKLLTISQSSPLDVTLQQDMYFSFLMIHMTTAPYTPMSLHRSVSRNLCLKFSLDPSPPTAAQGP